MQVAPRYGGSEAQTLSPLDRAAPYNHSTRPLPMW